MGPGWGGGCGGGHREAALLARMEELFRGSRQGQERWQVVCKGYGKGPDPTQHDPMFLESFFAALEVEGWNLPPIKQQPEELYGPQGGGYGRDRGSYGMGVGGFGKGFGSAAPYARGDFPKGGGFKGGKKGESSVEVSEKVFVGGLPPAATEDDIREFFSGFGDLLHIELKMLATGQQHRGFGFVTFAEVMSAQAVIDSFESNMILGKWVEVKAADPGQKGFAKGGAEKGDVGFGAKGWGKDGCGKKGGKDYAKADIPVSEKIFVGKLATTLTDDDIFKHFSEWGEVVDVVLKVDAQGVSRGFGFVTFADVAVAQAILDNKDSNMLDGAWFDVRPADAEFTKGKGKDKGKGKGEWTEDDITEKLFIGGLPLETTEPEVRLFCEQYGRTKEVSLKYNSDHQFRGFAFVTFDAADAARALLKRPEDAVICGQLAEVRPARPSENFHELKRHAKQEPVFDDSPIPITSNVIKVGGMYTEPKQRDVFKFFYNFSVTRIRDCGGDDCYVEFMTPAEAQNAYREKKGANMSGVPVWLADASRQEFDEAANRMPLLSTGQGGPKAGGRDEGGPKGGGRDDGQKGKGDGGKGDGGRGDYGGGEGKSGGKAGKGGFQDKGRGGKGSDWVSSWESMMAAQHATDPHGGAWWNGSGKAKGGW